MTMELSMTIALGSALAIREYFTALIILLFVLIAEMLEELTVGRGRRAIQTLLDLMPKQASVRRDGSLMDLPIEQVNPGDIVVVKPGAGNSGGWNSSEGYSFVDQSSITVSPPEPKRWGTTVFAGTTNLSGSLEVATDKLGRDTVFGKIVEAVEHAEQSRAPVQKTADRLSGYLVTLPSPPLYSHSSSHTTPAPPSRSSSSPELAVSPPVRRSRYSAQSAARPIKAPSSRAACISKR